MIKKNEYYDLECVDLTHEGLGVCKIDNYPVFVKNMLPGESGQIKLVKMKKNYAFGRLVELYKTSSSRVTPVCNIFKQCGGCQIQHMDNNLQLQMKKNRVKEAYKRIANMDIFVHDVFSLNEYRYRNKVQVPVAKDKNGNINYGFYQSRTHDIIPMDDCVIQTEISNNIVKRVTELFTELSIEPYDEKQHVGNIRHVMTRVGTKTDDIMLVLVTRNREINNIDKFIPSILKEFPMITTIVQNINNKVTNVILGEKEIILYGDGYIYDFIGDIKFKISSKSFFQVNSALTERLYDKAISLAKIDKNDVVIDAYCGIGTISLLVAKQAKKVYGVEIVERAIQDAKENASINNITNTEFVVGDASEVIVRWYKSGINADVVIVDPPRKGLSEDFINTLIKMNPNKIVYISCDVSTQARDIVLFKNAGYDISESYPFDMFPQTHHVETVLLIEKK